MDLIRPRQLIYDRQSMTKGPPLRMRQLLKGASGCEARCHDAAIAGKFQPEACLGAAIVDQLDAYLVGGQANKPDPERLLLPAFRLL